MLRFGAKVPGLGIDVRSVNMDFTYGSAFTVDSPDAYETLILDALLGDASLFTRADEVEAAWSIVTPIIESWADEPSPRFPSYEAGLLGPDDADELMVAMAVDEANLRRQLSVARQLRTEAQGGAPRRHWPEVADGGGSDGASAGGPVTFSRRRPASPRSPAPGASTIEGIEMELARIWAQPVLDHDFDDGVPDRHVGARTSVMNLVVVARRPGDRERCAAIIHALTGHPPGR